MLAEGRLTGREIPDCAAPLLSVKVKEGVPVTELAAQLGHARKSMTRDTYWHVLISE